jgi:hypothetical protein
MKNRLEKFIRDNREEFDTFEPPKDLWKKIDKGITKKEGKNGEIFHFGSSMKTYRRAAFRIAASVAILLSFSYVGFRYWTSNSGEVAPFSDNPTYAKLATQYTTTIELKREELSKLEHDDPTLFHQFDGELKALEVNYAHLKDQLPKNPNQEELLKAMIQNLQWQIDMLNQQLNIIQKIKEAKNGKVKDIV